LRASKQVLKKQGHSQAIMVVAQLPMQQFADALFDQDKVEVVIDDRNFKRFSRRSRRRLRDLQRTSKVSIELNRLRGILRISGSQQSVDEVQSQLVDLGGLYRQVPVAMWAELLRTRMEGFNPEAPMTVAWIQHHSGCRIHIERSSSEVRLFGSSEHVQRAVYLVDEVAKHAAEEIVTYKAGRLSEDIVEELAQVCGVTMQCQQDHIAVLGRRFAVLDATNRLRALLDASPRSFQEEAPRAADLPLPLRIVGSDRSHAWNTCMPATLEQDFLGGVRPIVVAM